MMPYIHHCDKHIPFVKPNDSYVHIYAEFKQVLRTLDTFGPQRRVKRVFRKN